MLPKKNRVDKKVVEALFKEGKFVNSPNLSLRFIFAKQDFAPKVSFISPKTSSKSAVIRNLLRRRGYIALKKYFNKLPRGFFGVFVFGKKSLIAFGGKKSEDNNPILNLENEIKIILNRL